MIYSTAVKFLWLFSACKILGTTTACWLMSCAYCAMAAAQSGQLRQLGRAPDMSGKVRTTWISDDIGTCLEKKVWNSVSGKYRTSLHLVANCQQQQRQHGANAGCADGSNMILCLAFILDDTVGEWHQVRDLFLCIKTPHVIFRLPFYLRETSLIWNQQWDNLQW